MLYKLSLLILIVLVLPIGGYSQSSEGVHSIEKQKLICLHKRLDDYLKRKTEPVMVILESKCPDPMIDGDDRIRSLTLPIFNHEPSKEGDDSTLTASDVYMLTKKQLDCFKHEFDNSIRDDSRTFIPIDFGKLCRN